MWLPQAGGPPTLGWEPIETIPLLPSDGQGPRKPWKVLQVVRAGQILTSAMSLQQENLPSMSVGLDPKG